MAKDFRKKTFTKILRGYAPEEVHEYIAYINEEYRKIERRNAENERKLALALKKLDEAQSLTEANDNNAAISAETAEKTAALLREAAEKAEMILASANEEAAKIRSDAAAQAKIEADGVREAASEMYDEVCSFRDSLFELYNNHIESIESITESARACVDKTDAAYVGAVGGEFLREEVLGEDDEVIEAEMEDEPEDEPEPEAVDYDDSGDMTAFDDDDDTDGITPVRDIYIDLSDADLSDADLSDADLSDEDESDLSEDGDDDDEGFSYADADDDPETELQIDWKKRRAVVNETADDDLSDADLSDADLSDADLSDDDLSDAKLSVDMLDELETRVLDLRAVREAAKPAADSDFEEGEITVRDFSFDLPDDDDSDDSGKDDDKADDIESEFGDLDFLFTVDEKESEFSAADEFDMVFSSSDTKKEIEEIRRQPLVVQEEPKNKKKHSKFN